jgi:hypothetical protein
LLFAEIAVIERLLKLSVRAPGKTASGRTTQRF